MCLVQRGLGGEVVKNIVIVPVVCGPQMSQRCVNSLLAQDIGDVQVQIIGNGAIDGTVQVLTARYWNEPRVEIAAFAGMRSLHTIWNRWIERALEHEAYVMVVNNDVVLRPDTYRLLRDDGGLFVTGVSVGRMEEIATCDPTSKRPHPDFSCFLIRRECWERVGRFDEDLFAYAGDASYHLMMDRAGVDAVSLAVPFYHERSSTIRLVHNDLRDWLQKRADEDRETFKRKYGFAVGSDEYYAQFKRARENRYAKEGVL